jgi:hypothetical protein
LAGDYTTIGIITKPAEDEWQVPRPGGTESGIAVDRNAEESLWTVSRRRRCC